MQSCCCHSPAPLSTAESKAQGWGCCRTFMACQEMSGLGLNGETKSHSPTERLSDVSLELCFPHPIPAQFSFLVPLLFLSTPRALISLPSQVSSIRLLAVFCLTQPSTGEASRLPQNLGHRIWHLHPDPPKVGVYGGLGTQPRCDSSCSLPAPASYILCSWLAAQETQFHTRISRMVLTHPSGGYSFNPVRHFLTHWESQMQQTGAPESLLQ